MRIAVCLLKRICAIPLAVVLFSCSTQGTAPVVSRQPEQQAASKTPTTADSSPGVSAAPSTKPGTGQNKQGFHIVNKGDTLYSIAWIYGFDFREIATWNKIQSPYLIYPGQVLRLKPGAEKKTPALQPGPIVDTSPGPVVDAQPPGPVLPDPVTTEPATPVATTPEQVKQVTQSKTATIKAVGQTEKISWNWPVKGLILKSTSPTSKKGVDISGRLGQDIKAAAQGDVVYSGSGLLGYGRLIIIKHNETFLSAYAYNSELLVKEGDSVSTGQVIAKMGKSNAGQAQLHFEIRENGKSVNPLKLLPKS